MPFPKKPSLLMKYKDEDGNMYEYTSIGWTKLSGRPKFNRIKKERKGLKPSDRFMKKDNHECR